MYKVRITKMFLNRGNWTEVGSTTVDLLYFTDYEEGVRYVLNFNRDPAICGKIGRFRKNVYIMALMPKGCHSFSLTKTLIEAINLVRQEFKKSTTVCGSINKLSDYMPDEKIIKNRLII